MDFYERLKRFMGFHQPQDFNDQSRNLPRSPQNDDRDRYFRYCYISILPRVKCAIFSFETPFHKGPNRNFNVFTDPLEIHKYFEQQMSDMLRSFGFGEFGDGFSHHFEFPQIEEIPQEEYETQSGDLRDQFLKPGFEDAATNGIEEKKDGDVDGKLDIRDWGSVFKGENSVTPYQRQTAPKSYFFGQSVTSKTIKNPDGSVETHHTVRDNQGNEETTITRKMADKEYSVTKRRDKDGKEETIENFVNMDDKEVDTFFPKQPQRVPELDQRSWPFFDRFFK
ncbi:HCLS1-associated protein X-1 [Asbolus verrucosus]|uniref:HCLS1-associated protein X-1 n=1 Tax=Asbolus verrucosus TaxID=1661398 RepID=A0A482W7U9_ASBVE|nr:HCLS1-associated protein X-1 [Asbolus verrucosus]